MRVPVRLPLFGCEGDVPIDKIHVGSLHRAGLLKKLSKLGRKIFDSQCSYIKYLTCRQSKEITSGCCSRVKT